MADNKILQAILDRVVNVDENVKKMEIKMDKGFKDVNERVDKLGLQIARLEDDAPTISEFGRLEKRVDKLENKFVSV